ncbi:ABC transporter permease [Metallumcola ferriviriculae]|uniref:ABC transporter permease n=1 Tax=Metallumcola ferriviriculae TaxID=3039180 RepID=A0AAU0UN61_9FIRM|nr:ABC transporter permease [Desulfitibacteraceae bacterium MK1]
MNKRTDKCSSSSLQGNNNLLQRLLTRGAKSTAHAEFLKKYRVEQLLVRLTQLAILIAFVGFWEVGASQGWIDPLLFSKPSKIWVTFYKMLMTGQLHQHIIVTVTETFAGFILGTLSGTLLAIIIWWSPFLSKVLDPYLVILNGMPKVALGPTFIVAFGGGYGGILAMAVAISIIITTIVVYSSFKEVDSNLIRLARSFGAVKKQIFSKIVLPASFPTIVSTLKVNVGLAWVGVIVGEFLVSKQGLGYLIIYGFQVFNLTLVFVSLFIIAICATLMYQAVSYFESRILKNRE